MEGCDKRYTDPSSLRKHMKSNAHGENRQKSGLTSQVTGNKNGSVQNNSNSNSEDFKISNAHKPYACKVEGCNKRYTDPSSLRKHQRATSHGRDPNTFKSKIVSKAVQNKNSVLNSQVSNGAIKKVTKCSESSSNTDNSTKEFNLQKNNWEVKSNTEDPKPLDLSVSSSDDSSVVFQSVLFCIEKNNVNS